MTEALAIELAGDARYRTSRLEWPTLGHSAVRMAEGDDRYRQEQT